MRKKSTSSNRPRNDAEPTPREPRFHHAPLAVVDTPGVGRAYRVLSAPLDRYRSRRQITDAQWAAGTWFRDQAERAGVIGWAKSQLNISVGGMPAEQTTAQVAARRAYYGALDDLGPVAGDVLIKVCVEEIPAGDWAKIKGEREDYGMGRLREALDQLIEWRSRRVHRPT